GAAAAEHWYRRAVGLSSGRIDAMLRAYGQELDVERTCNEAHLPFGRLVRIKDHLIAIHEGGDPMLAEGEDLQLTSDDHEHMRQVASSGRCECQHRIAT